MGNPTSKIWRSVVFAGAMLGTPLATADTASKPKPASTDTLASAQLDLETNTKAAQAALDVAAAAKSDAERKAAVAKLEALRKERLAIQERIALLATGTVKLEAQLAVATHR